MEPQLDESQNASPSESTAPTEPAPTGWIGWSLVAGLAAAIPSGYLLAYLAALPFLLGLFFFLLLGLIVGATMFRAGRRAPAPSAAVLWTIGSAVALALMFTSLWAEYQALPRSVEKRVRKSIYESLTPEKRAELSRAVREYVDSQIQTQYPPGGFVGYLRWAVTSGTFECPRILRPGSVPYRLSHRRAMWVIRVGLSLLMVEWTLMAQLVGLRKRPREQTAEEAEAAAQVPK